MLANSSSEALSADKSSRNKRKFRADTPSVDPYKFVSMPDNDLPVYEFPSQKMETTQNHEIHCGCEICCSVSLDLSDPLELELGLPTGIESSNVNSEQPKDEKEEVCDFADWTDFTETELEELVLNDLEMIFKGAMKNIVAFGYSEKVAYKAVLRAGVHYGPKDIISNIVNNALLFIRNGSENDSSKEHCFEDLEQLEKYVLAELVCSIREVRSSFSVGDALWRLLLWDMNVTNACSLDSSSSGNVRPGECTPKILQPDAKIETTGSEFSFSATSKSNPCSQTCECKAIPVSGVPNTVKSKKSPVNPISLSGNDLKSTCTRKISGITKREYMLRQKALNLERYRSAKGSSRSGKHLSSFGGLVLDKKLRSLSESEGINFKSATVKLTKTTVTDKPQEMGTETEIERKSSPPETISETKTEVKANTELSLSPLSEWFQCNKKDVMLTRLLTKERVLRDQLRQWNEWANEKVMQAAKRLGKDKAELKALRQERDEAERVRKEQQTLEENTMKKLSEMENALRKAGGQMERANGAVWRLEGQNAWLRREMEAAKARAKEAAASCREGVKREKEAVSKIQSWEKEKGLFQEELVAEKRRVAQLHQKVGLAKDRRDQQEARWKQEEKAKEEVLKEVNSIKTERGELEASTKAQEDTIKANAKTNLKKYKDNIQKLEEELSQLRMKTDSSKIAALRRGIEHMDPNKVCIRDPSKTVANVEEEISGLKRERECVMCLSDEMSVVFLPCAHQVVCAKCNELHEKQGMKDCPSCRTPIQQRICARFARK